MIEASAYLAARCEYPGQRLPAIALMEVEISRRHPRHNLNANKQVTSRRLAPARAFSLQPATQQRRRGFTGQAVLRKPFSTRPVRQLPSCSLDTQSVPFMSIHSGGMNARSVEHCDTKPPSSCRLDAFSPRWAVARSCVARRPSRSAARGPCRLLQAKARRPRAACRARGANSLPDGFRRGHSPITHRLATRRRDAVHFTPLVERISMMRVRRRLRSLTSSALRLNRHHNSPPVKPSLACRSRSAAAPSSGRSLPSCQAAAFPVETGRELLFFHDLRFTDVASAGDAANARPRASLTIGHSRTPGTPCATAASRGESSRPILEIASLENRTAAAPVRPALNQRRRKPAIERSTARLILRRPHRSRLRPKSWPAGITARASFSDVLRYPSRPSPPRSLGTSSRRNRR